ncbi:MAG: T9SS type A sorting domain-containing protein, partial [Ignavibacteria bacterium]
DTRLTNNSAQSNYVSVSSSGVNVHCVWQDYRDTTTEVYYKRSTDAGNTWSADARLTNNPAASNGPTISVTGQNAHVFWSDTRIGNAELYYKRSTDGGASWSSDTRLTFAADEANNPGSFAFGPFVAITWSGWRTGFYEIYYKSSIDGGLNWSNDLQLTPSSNSGGSYKPSIDVSDSAAHVVWYDNRDGNNEVYYKKNIFSFPVGITNTNPETPTEFSLSQNFPNPFNPVTNIGFRIADFGFVSLKVYDVMGKEVAALINEDLSIGIYNVSFDASGLASGIYLYKLESNDFSQTRKMVLIK